MKKQLQVTDADSKEIVYNFKLSRLMQPLFQSDKSLKLGQEKQKQVVLKFNKSVMNKLSVANFSRVVA